MSEIMANIELFKARCRDAGLKITPQRIAVYKALSKSKEHPSAEFVYKIVKKEIPSISFDTVNRTLNTLADIGAAFIVEGTGDVKRFDANLDDHQHFKCVKCKRIVDYDHSEFENIKVPEEIEKKFKVLSTSVLIEGICDHCLREDDK